MKKILSLLLTFLLLTVTASAAPVIDITEEKTLIKGVTYKNIKGLYESGWQDIHVVTADLSEEHLSLEVLKNTMGESYMETTLQAAKNNDTVVAVNADFFAAKRGEAGRGSAIGVEIRDGKLYSSASVEEAMSTLYKAFDENGFNIDAFSFDITITAANGAQDKIRVINKYDDLKGIVMYTSDWNDTSIGSVGGVIEVAVDKTGTVVEKVTEAEPLTIPEDGYVLSAHMSYNTFLLDNVNVGEKLSVDIASAPDYEKIETAVGGGAVLVRDGVAQTSFSHNISGRNPRTAIGLDETGTIVTLVVLDGRRADAKGMTQAELAELMAELGCYSALNFDGGGSAAMVLNEAGAQTVANEPSDGSLRKVTNSVGITTTAENNAKLKGIKLDIPQYAFAGYGVELSAYGVDTYLRKVELEDKITYKTDNGTVRDGILIPEKAGTAKITANCKGKTATAEITVLDEITELSFSQDKVELKSGNTYIPTLIAKDINGRMAELMVSEVELVSSAGCVTVDEGIARAVSKGGAHITAKIGDITANMQVLVDGAASIGTIENIKIADPQNISSELADGGYRFAVFGNTKSNETMFDMFVMNRATIKMKQSSDFQYILGGDVNTATLSHIEGTYHTAKQYSCEIKNGDTFITLPNTNSKIYTDDVSVWTKFRNDVENSKGNLFVFIDRNLISENETEVKLFKEILEVAAEGKSVYVFGGGFVNKYTVENNVRYVNTAGFFPSVTLEGTSVDYIKYVLVTVNGDEVTYEYKQAVR